jgi:hypothetical protein
VLILALLLADVFSFGLRGGAAYVGGQAGRDAWAQSAGATALYRGDTLLLGASFDASSRVGSLRLGDARHLFFAGAAGAAFELSDKICLDLLGEAGLHRVSGTRFGPKRFYSRFAAAGPSVDLRYPHSIPHRHLVAGGKRPPAEHFTRERGVHVPFYQSG